MSLYGDYIAEREGFYIVEDDCGFATFRYNFEALECYIRDIYVKPAHRKDHVASRYADKIAELAKDEGCKHLTGTVAPGTAGATASLKVLLAYGFKLHSIQDGLIWFSKEL